MIASTALPIKMPLFRRFPESVADLSREFLLRLLIVQLQGKSATGHTVGTTVEVSGSAI
jgi:hypothetical protein